MSAQVHVIEREVYFATSKDGDRLKIGVSIDGEARCRSSRWDLIGTVPGDFAYEAAAHWALRDYRIDGEWFRSCAPVWRAVLGIVDDGAIGWLPPQPGYAADPNIVADARRWFGSTHAAAEAVDLQAKTFAQCTSRTPGVLWGRLYTEIARKAGRLPDYLETSPPEARSQNRTAEAR